MDFKAPATEQARTLLRKMVEVEGWVKAGDPRAKPYLDADAVRIVDGKGQFHRDRFLKVYADELVTEIEGSEDHAMAEWVRAAMKEHNN